jgi:CDP-diacylglycerol--serine O-phosphatidyltransferase
MKVSRTIVPSFFTVGNMFCGFFSVTSALNHSFELAAWLIFAAAFLDIMDGKIARFTGTSSKFGVEYDSLADVISFGFAPSFLIYTIYLNELRTVGLLISFIPLLFGSIRLARFNSQLKGFDKTYFTGLPIPVAALAITSAIIFSLHYYDNPVKFPKILLILIFFVSILMVSTVKYEIMPVLTFKGSTVNKVKVILIFLGVFLIIYAPQKLLFPIILLYIIAGVFRWIYYKVFSEDSKSESKN